MQANEPNATECFSRSRWHKVGQVSPLLYKRRQDGGPLHSQIFSVQRSLNLLNTGKLALSFVRKRVKRGADSSDGRNSGPSIVARGRQCVSIVSVVVIAGAQPAPWNRASALKVTVRLFLCKAMPSFFEVSEYCFDLNLRFAFYILRFVLLTQPFSSFSVSAMCFASTAVCRIVIACFFLAVSA